MSDFPDHPDRRPALVTGASSGIGAATVTALSAAGFPVVLAARRVERLEELADVLRANGGEAAVVRLDVTDDESVGAAAAAAQEAMGPIEVVVSNAGDMVPAAAHTADTATFLRQLDTNLVGAHRLVVELLAPMVERRRGDIVLVTSQNASTPRPLVGAYNASKAGLESFGRTLQMELEGSGVRASIVRPGPTFTEMGWSWDPVMIDRCLKDWKRWGLLRHHQYLPAESIAAAVVSVVAAPRGTHLSLVEVNPEAPIRDED
ncbi:MAG: SDR family oxidoreductase [Acidimicrobiales bacterium]